MQSSELFRRKVITMFRDILIVFISIWVGPGSGQWLSGVQVEPLPPVRAGDTATFTCTFTGNNITVQYIAWTKISKQGRRTFVYEYSEHPPIRKAYNDFTGRTSVDGLQGNREESRVALQRVLSRTHERKLQPVHEDIDIGNTGDISLSNAWKMPQDDFVEPSNDEYRTPDHTKITLNERNNLLISDEVQRDLQHHVQVINTEYNARSGNDPVDIVMNPKTVESKEENFVFDGRKYARNRLSKNSVKHDNFASSSANVISKTPVLVESDNTKLPVLKLDIRTETTENTTVTMPTIPISGGDSMAVTMATNHGQIPIYDINVRNYENPLDLRKTDKIRDDARDPGRSFEQNRRRNYREPRKSRTHYFHLHSDKSYDPHEKVDQKDETYYAKESDMRHLGRDRFNKDATTTIGSLSPPLKDSKWVHHKPFNPTKESEMSMNTKNNKYQPKPKYKPRNSLRRMYFSRHTPDLRFKRDLSRVMRPPAGQADHMSLNVHDVTLEDEAMYECQVKPLGGPARWGRAQLNVHVAPGWPTIDAPVAPYQEKQNGTIECRGNVGKPAGTLRWYRKRAGQDIFTDLPIETKAYSLSNGSSVAVSKLNLAFAEYDDGAIYRCVATSSIMAAQEDKPQAQIQLSVQYAPREGRILFDTALGRYYCHARGNPTPTYAWLWMRPDGRQTIMSSDRYLDLKGMRRSGYYRFHCLASNVIHGVRHTKVMATKLRVIAPETTTTSTTTTTLPTTTTITTTTTPAPTTTTTKATTITTTINRPFNDPNTKYEYTKTTSYKSSNRPHGYISRLDVMREQEEELQEKQKRKDKDYDDGNNNRVDDEDYFYDDGEYDDGELKAKTKNEQYSENREPEADEEEQGEKEKDRKFKDLQK